MEKKTVGSVASELLRKSDGKQGVVDTEREASKDYLDQVHECVAKAEKEGWDKPFYCVVLLKKERVLENVVRRYFVARKTMPGPDYDQTVFLYNPKTGDLRYLWTIPDPGTCEYLYHAGTDIDPQERDLQAMVIDFIEDRLYDKCASIYENKNEWAAEVYGHATKQNVQITTDGSV